MDKIQIVEMQGQRVLTTRQIAEMYGTKEEKIRWNFNYNRKKYIEGKHYILVQGEELKQLKRECENQTLFKQAKSVCFWTEKGALLHAKSINTDKAWEVYDYLVDFYFRVNDGELRQQVKDIVPVKQTVEQVPDGISDKRKDNGIRNTIQAFQILLNIAEENNICVRSVEFKSRASSVLNGDCIGIRAGQTLEKVVYELAYELAHYCIHNGAGNMLKSSEWTEYNKRAEKAADMILAVVNETIALRQREQRK